MTRTRNFGAEAGAAAVGDSDTGDAGRFEEMDGVYWDMPYAFSREEEDGEEDGGVEYEDLGMGAY